MSIPPQARIPVGLAALFIGLNTFFGGGPDFTPCTTGTPDSKLAGCSALIDGGKLRGRDLAVAHLQRGLVRDDANSLDAAVADYAAAITADPKYALAYSNRAYAYGRLGQLKLAHADLETAEKLDPKLGVIYRNKTFIYSLEGNNAAATVAAEKAIELTPGDPENHYNMGVLKAERGDVQGALAAYAKAI